METEPEKIMCYGYIVAKVASKTKQGLQKFEYAVMIPNKPPLVLSSFTDYEVMIYLTCNFLKFVKTFASTVKNN